MGIRYFTRFAWNTHTYTHTNLKYTHAHTQRKDDESIGELGHNKTHTQKVRFGISVDEGDWSFVSTKFPTGLISKGADKFQLGRNCWNDLC